MDTVMNKILQAILRDQCNGVKKSYTEYLHYFGEFQSKEDRNRALNRIQKMMSRRRKKEFIVSRAPESDRTPITIQEYIDYAKVGKRFNRLLNNMKYYQKLDFDEPIVICFSSDQHLGSSGCDYDTFMKDMQFIMENDVKLVLNGDMIECKKEFPKNLFSVLSQVLSVEMQEDLVTKLLQAMENNILAYVSGNHEVNARHGEENSMKRCCREANVDFFEGAALLDINIDGANYKIYARHKPASNSKVSPLLGARKLKNFENSADIYVTSHIHVPTYGVDWPNGEKRICIITGTYNNNAQYSRIGYGEYSARQEFPCILLFPKTKKSMVFMSMRDAVAYRDMVKGKQ